MVLHPVLLPLWLPWFPYHRKVRKTVCKPDSHRSRSKPVLCDLSGPGTQGDGASSQASGGCAVSQQDHHAAAVVEEVVSTASGLGAQINAILCEQKKVDEKLKKSSSEIDDLSFAAMEAFPASGSGAIMFQSKFEENRISKELDDFLCFDASRNQGRAQSVWPQIIISVYPFMMDWSLKMMIMALCARTFFNRATGKACLDVIEFFAGRAELSRAAIRKNQTVLAFDKVLSDAHDVIQDPRALRIWFAALASTRKGSLVWHGTQCSSFSIMCRSNSGRAEANNWLGDIQQAFVNEGNWLADLSALSLFLAKLMDCVEVLEQSGTSCMPKVPSMCGVLEYIQANRVLTYHAAYGSPSLKPFQLWSSSTMIESLARQKPSGGCVETLAVRSEDGQQYTGVHEKLQESEHYTPLFGKAIIESWMTG